jgi:predicted dehydrogenase
MGTGLAKACNELDSAEVVAIADVRQEALDKAGKELLEAAAKQGKQIRPTAYLNYEEMLAKEKLQAAIVASPGFLHRGMVEKAAAAKLHVFCEKPMALTVPDCNTMIAACKKNGVKLMIGQVCRYHGVHSKVRQLIHSGEFGKPICMIVRRLGGGFGGIYRQSWRQKMAESGGLLMEVNAHEIDFMRFVCGDVARVFAVGGRYAATDIDWSNENIVSMVFRSGAVGCLHASAASVIGGYGGRVDCDGGGLEFASIWGANAGINACRQGAKPNFIPASQLQVENPVRHEVRDFIEAIIKDAPAPVPGEEGRAAVEIACAAYRSMETGQPVDLGSDLNY